MENPLYPITIVEREAGQVHYEGYGTEYNEWKDKDEIELLDSSENSSGPATQSELPSEQLVQPCISSFTTSSEKLLKS